MTFLAFLTIGLVCLIVLFIYLFFVWDEDWMIGVILSAILFIFSFVGSTIPDIVKSRECRQAEVMKGFDSLIVKAPDWPEQFSTDFNCLEKPVRIVRTTYTNSWGLNENVGYTIEVIPVEKQ